MGSQFGAFSYFRDRVQADQTQSISPNISAKEQIKQLSILEKKLSTLSSQLNKNNHRTNKAVLPHENSLKSRIKHLKEEIQTLKESIGETAAETPSWFKNRAVVLTTKLMAQLPKDHPLITHNLQERITKAAKNLQKGSYVVIASKPKHLTGSVIITKDLKGNLDILIPQGLLGSGTVARAWLTKSVSLGQTSVVKVAVQKRSAPKEAQTLQNIAVQEDFDNESKISAILNAHGKHRGIPETRTTSTHASTQEDKILHSSFYSRGDFTEHANWLTLANFFKLTPMALKKLSPKQLQNLISNNIQQIANPTHAHELKKLEIFNACRELESKIAAGDQNVDNERKLKELQKMRDEFPQMDTNFTSLLAILAACLSQKEKQILDDKINKLMGLEDDPDSYTIQSIQQASSEIFIECQRLLTELSIKAQTIPLGRKNELQHRFADVLEGLLYIHNSNIIHGDIKPGNFLWNEKEAVVADLGGARIKDSNYGIPMSSPRYTTDTHRMLKLKYKQAKDLDNWFRVGRAGDMRAMGLSLVQIYTGLLPPEGDDAYKKDTYQNIYSELRKRGMDTRTATLITKLCNPRPKINPNEPPKEFPLPLTDKEYIELIALLDKY